MRGEKLNYLTMTQLHIRLVLTVNVSPTNESLGYCSQDIMISEMSSKKRIQIAVITA